MNRKTIYRNARPDSGYAEISNRLLQCKGLSLEARGFQAFFLSQKQDWRFNMVYACRELGIGEHKAERIVNELIEKGFVRRTRDRREDGTLGPVVYEFTDVPNVFGEPEDSHSAEITEWKKEESVSTDRHSAGNHSAVIHPVVNHPTYKELRVERTKGEKAVRVYGTDRGGQAQAHGLAQGDGGEF